METANHILLYPHKTLKVTLYHLVLTLSIEIHRHTTIIFTASTRRNRESTKRYLIVPL